MIPKSYPIKEFARNATIYVEKTMKLVGLMDMRLWFTGKDSEDKESIQHLAYIVKLYTFNNFESLWRNTYCKEKDILDKKDDFQLDGKYLFTSYADDPFIDKKSQLAIRRRAILDFLGYVKENKLNKYKAFSYELNPEVSNYDLTYGKAWNKFLINNFDDKKHQSSSALAKMIDALKAPVQKNLSNPIAALKENKIWDDHKGGQILFSDNDGVTMSFKGEGLHSDTGSNIGNRERLLEVLLTIN